MPLCRDGWAPRTTRFWHQTEGISFLLKTPFNKAYARFKTVIDFCILLLLDPMQYGFNKKAISPQLPQPDPRGVLQQHDGFAILDGARCDHLQRGGQQQHRAVIARRMHISSGIRSKIQPLPTFKPPLRATDRVCKRNAFGEQFKRHIPVLFPPRV